MRPFSAALNTLRGAPLGRNWDLNDEEYMKIFSSMLYTVLGQQWTSSTMTAGCQWSSRSRTILERIAAGSGPVIAENALRTSTNKEVWIASILGNWGAMGLNFRIPHTKGMWGKRKNECQGLQSFLHTLMHGPYMAYQKPTSYLKPPRIIFLTSSSSNTTTTRPDYEMSNFHLTASLPGNTVISKAAVRYNPC